MLKKGTIYIYDSKRSCLNNPQQPSIFYNLNMSKIRRNGNFLTIDDGYSHTTLWSID
jgi:hypothetical protein